jgi:hypothetical protein
MATHHTPRAGEPLIYVPPHARHKAPQDGTRFLVEKSVAELNELVDQFAASEGFPEFVKDVTAMTQPPETFSEGFGAALEKILSGAEVPPKSRKARKEKNSPRPAQPPVASA